LVKRSWRQNRSWWSVLEIATDKVDSEVPSEVSGVLLEKCFGKDDLVQVGQTIAIIEIEGEASQTSEKGTSQDVKETAIVSTIETEVEEKYVAAASSFVAETTPASKQDFSNSDKFFSPLVKNIAKQEAISISELESIKGSGSEGRVTKNDVLSYIATRGKTPVAKQSLL